MYAVVFWTSVMALVPLVAGMVQQLVLVMTHSSRLD
jgi:hypothetical protein